jgi:hypothetical protein
MTINTGGIAGHPFPYSQTLTLLKRVPGDPDEYGNDTYTDMPVEVDYCIVTPTGSTETVQWTDQVSTDLNVFCPYGTDVGPLDAWVVAGQTYEIQGVPQVWRSPFSGNTSMIQCRSSLVTGASVQ